MKRSARILIVEDDEAHADALRMALEMDGHKVELAKDPESALDRLHIREFDLVLTDLQLGGDIDGLDLIQKAREEHESLSFFLITGHGTVETAVRAMKEGATDYLTKPVNIIELRTRVTRELDNQRLSRDNQQLRHELRRREGLEGMVGDTPPMRRVFAMVKQAGPTEATVLVLGESGTGKELVAQALHQLSSRQKGRFVAVNCAALTESLIESELFGHAKGAFTGAERAKSGKFEYANGGTLFLDEIGDMPLGTQAKLLRVLENRMVTPVGANEEIPIDVRIVAATNLDLKSKIEAGEFRKDLFYRLEGLTIELPPLRERLADLPLLIHHFRQQSAERHRKTIHAVADPLLGQLASHEWPGNVRELRNLIDTLTVLDGDGVLGLDDLPPSFPLRQLVLPPAQEEAAQDIGYSLAGKTLAQVEQDLIEDTLERVGHNRARAAASLGMGERTLYRKIKGYEKTGP